MNVTVREFCLRPGKYLSSLPVELTRYGSVVAILQTPDKISKKNSESISEKKLEIFNDLKSEVPNVVPMGIPEPKNSEMKQAEVKTFWYQGKKYFVDEFGNEKEAK
ncbi:MAG: hypothetical protein WC479_02830 [Candidatus Izemoplasmatales bacterium]